MVSASTLVISAQARLPHWKPRPQPAADPVAPASRSAASGTSVASARRKSRHSRDDGRHQDHQHVVAEIEQVDREEVADAVACRCSTREIRSPVRLPPKNSSDSRCRWA